MWTNILEWLLYNFISQTYVSLSALINVFCCTQHTKRDYSIYSAIDTLLASCFLTLSLLQLHKNTGFHHINKIYRLPSRLDCPRHVSCRSALASEKHSLSDQVCMTAWKGIVKTSLFQIWIVHICVYTIGTYHIFFMYSSVDRHLPLILYFGYCV